MLKILRKYQKKILKVVVPFIIFVFIVFYGGNTFKNRNRQDETNFVAKVDGQIITPQEYKRTYDNFYQYYRARAGENWSDSMVDMLDLKNMALDNLINQELLYLAAKHSGLEATDAEVSSAISENYASRQGMTVKAFLDSISQNGIDTASFIEEQRKSVLVNKMQQFIMSNVHVSEQEVEQEYKNRQEKVSGIYLAFKPESYLSEISEPSPEQVEEYFEDKKERFKVPDKVKIDYIEIDPEDFTGLVSVTDSEVERYYENHGEEYEVPEKVRVDYINLSAEKFQDQVTLTEEEILEYYESNKARYMTQPKVRVRYVALDFEALKNSIVPTEEEIQAQYEERKNVFKSKEERQVRWIVMTVPESDTGQMRVEKRQKLLDLKKEIEAGTISFADAAIQHSEGQFKESGGLIGTKTMDELVPFDIAEEAFFTLDKGQISDVVNVRGGIALVYVEDIVEPQVQTLDQVRDQVVDSLKYEKAREQATETLTALKEQLGYHIDPSQVPEGLIFRETKAFSRGDDIDEVVSDQDKGTFTNAALMMREEGTIGNIVEGNENWYLMELVEKVPVREMTSDEAREKVVTDKTKEKAMTVAAEAAEKAYLRIKNGESYDAVAAELGVDVVDTGFITKDGRVPGIGWSPAEFMAAAFGLREGEISGVVKSPVGSHILRFVDKQEAHIPDLTENIANAIKRNLTKEESVDLAKQFGEGILYRSEIDESDLAYAALAEKKDWLETRLSDETARDESPIADIDFQTTDYFAQSENPEPLGQAPEFVQTAFNIDATGERASGLVTRRAVGRPDEVEAYYIMVLNDKKEAHIPDISDVSEEVKQSLMKSLAAELARQDAESIYADLEAWIAKQREGKPATAEFDLAEFARERDLSTQQARPFGRNDMIGDVGRSAALAYAAFNTPVGEVTKVVKAESLIFQEGEEIDRDILGYFIFQVQEHTEPSMDLYRETERKNIYTSMVDQRKQATIQDWLKEHRDNAQIEKKEEFAD